MPSYELSELNTRARLDPIAFLGESDAAFHMKVVDAAKQIRENMSRSRIVLLSGPSGSGKTTTAAKIEQVLHNMGIKTHTVSMDDYFLTVDPETAPRNEQGDMDFESPLCLDMELMNQHFDMLERGDEILIPKYVFTRQMRDMSLATPMRLGDSEIAIFEGIHALNDMITDRHPTAHRVYISARSNIEDAGELAFKGTWMRLVRRCVRDYNFRGSPVSETMKMWANVRTGEKKYISPFKLKANCIFDSSLPYEVSVMKSYALPIFSQIPKGAPRYDELRQLMEHFELFEPIDPALVRPDSLLREFIGGGSYDKH